MPKERTDLTECVHLSNHAAVHWMLPRLSPWPYPTIQAPTPKFNVCAKFPLDPTWEHAFCDVWVESEDLTQLVLRPKVRNDSITCAKAEHIHKARHVLLRFSYKSFAKGAFLPMFRKIMGFVAIIAHHRAPGAPVTPEALGN